MGFWGVVAVGRGFRWSRRGPPRRIVVVVIVVSPAKKRDGGGVAWCFAIEVLGVVNVRLCFLILRFWGVVKWLMSMWWYCRGFLTVKGSPL